MNIEELISRLKSLDPGLRVAVEDADTGWCAPIVDISVKVHESGETFLVIDPGDYSDMLTGEFKR